MVDKEFAIKQRLRCLLYNATKRYANGNKIGTSKKYGIDWNKIIEHLKPFPKDISKYHIDHKIALSRFNLLNQKEVRKAFAPENHQWLLAKDNLQKGARLI